MATWRRRVVRGGSTRPWRAALPVSARDGAAGRGAVGRGGGPQPVPLLGGDAGVADPVPLVDDAGAGAVLAGQHGDQVDVVRPVPDGDPPHRVVFLPARAQPGAVHHIPRDVGPFAVREQAVFGGGAHRAVPDRLGVSPLTEHVMRQPQQPGQAAEVPAPAGAQRGFEVFRGAVAGDDVRIGVLLPASGTIQVADQPGHILAARAYLPDHRSPVPGHLQPGRWNAIRSVPDHAERHPFRSRMRGTRRGMPSARWRARADRRPVIPDRRNAARILVRLSVRVVRVRGWCGGTASAGLPRPLPAGPIGGRSPPRTGEGHRTIARSRSASRPPDSSSRRSAAPRARHGPARVPHRPAAVRCRDLAPRGREGGFGGVRAARQPSPAWRAAADTSAYSVSVSANRTVRSRRA